MKPSTTLSCSALIAFAAFVLTGCGGASEHESTAKAAEQTPIRVSVVQTHVTDAPVIYEAVGTVRAATSTAVSSRLMGYIRDIKVNAGDRVSAGQLLLTIDSRELESALLQARAGESEARNGLAEADNAIAGAKAQLALADATFKRMQDLFQKKSISNQEFDEAQARYRTAAAAHEMAISKRSQLDSRIAQARQAVESASVMRGYAEMRAPFAGIVTERQAEPGQMATPGTPLLTLEQAGAYRLETPVEESLIGSIRLGQNVPVLLEAVGQNFNARITQIVPAVDPSSRAFIVKATLPPSALVRSGMFGRMRLNRGSKPAIMIPSAAVARTGELENVLVAESGSARLRMITTGMRHDSNIEVLSGLDEGERVIHPRPASLRDGSRIEAQQ